MELAANLLILVGLLVFFSSAIFRRPGVPFASLNPRHWKPLWHPDVKQALRPPGFTLIWAGMGLFTLGLALKWLPRWLG